MRAASLAGAVLFAGLFIFADESRLEPQMPLGDRVAQSKLIVIGKQGPPGPTGKNVNTSVQVEQVLLGSIPTNMTLYVSYRSTPRWIPDIASQKPMTFPKGGSRWVFFLTDEDMKQPSGTNCFTRAIGKHQWAHDGLELATEEVVKQVKEMVAKRQK